MHARRTTPTGQHFIGRKIIDCPHQYSINLKVFPHETSNVSTPTSHSILNSSTKGYKYISIRLNTCTPLLNSWVYNHKRRGWIVVSDFRVVNNKYPDSGCSQMTNTLVTCLQVVFSDCTCENHQNKCGNKAHNFYVENTSSPTGVWKITTYLV